MTRKKIFLPICTVFSLIILTSCAPTRQVNRGFYYWRSSFNISTEDNGSLKKLGVRRLYVKFFDVAWDKDSGQPLPVSVTRFNSGFPEGATIIPTVFITNETIKKLSHDHMELLAGQVHKKIHQMLAQTQPVKINEIQLDCDWTDGTRDKYFHFLKHFHALQDDNTEISATIRLHQIKYRTRTGVPPVDRGALMVYNLSHPANIKVENAIFDLKTSLNYLENVNTYPLPLDIALPIFSWGAVFQGDRFVGLINNLTSKALKNDTRFISLGDSRFQAQENAYLQGAYVYKNDVVRIDHSPISDIVKAGRFLAKKTKEREIRVILYHWNPQQMEEIGYEDYEALYHSLH